MTLQPGALADTGVDYRDAVAAFRLDELAAFFTGSLSGGINACVELCDRYASELKAAAACRNGQKSGWPAHLKAGAKKAAGASVLSDHNAARMF